MQLKSNLLTAVIIFGFSVLIGFFAFNFANETKETAKLTITEVNKTGDHVTRIITNLTDTVRDLTNLKAQELGTFRSGFTNLTEIMYQQINLIQEERNETKTNLALFLSTFDNQSTGMQEAVNELNRDSNASREKQTKAFIETLGLSQNLTIESQKYAQERNAIERNQTQQFDEIIKLLDQGNNKSTS
jgi:hypothetical protein